MSTARNLIARLAAEESSLIGSLFLSPCVRGGRVRTMVGGLPHMLLPRDRAFEGWGIFRAVSFDEAVLIEEASLPTIDAYLDLLARIRLRLVRRVSGGTWLAGPMSRFDALRCDARGARVIVHLVHGIDRFDAVIARYDGADCWFDTLNRRADPMIAEDLRAAAMRSLPAGSLRIEGMTPEDRSAYSLLFDTMSEARGRSDERRLRRALERGGGRLRAWHDRGEFWLVEWYADDEELHTSAIRKDDLTVIGAGICLSARDHDFDLQSLVGVVRDRPDWMR